MRRQGVAPIARQVLEGVVAVVAEQVADGVRHLSRRAQGARVVAVSENRPAATGEAVEQPGEAGREALHRLREAGSAFRLDDEVQVIALNRVMHEAKAEPIAAAFERPLEREQRAPAAQVPAAVSDAQRGVDRMR